MKHPLSAQLTWLLLSTKYLDKYSCSSPNTATTFLLCLALDSALSWSLSSSGPWACSSSAFRHLGEWVAAEALFPSYPCVISSSLQGQPGLSLDFDLSPAVLDSASFWKFLIFVWLFSFNSVLSREAVAFGINSSTHSCWYMMVVIPCVLHLVQIHECVM